MFASTRHTGQPESYYHGEGPWNHAPADPDMPYLYNGKELEGELGLGWYAYGFRYYDASVGRFVGVDPLAGEMPDWSPFGYAYSNPISFIDFMGLAPEWKPRLNGDGSTSYISEENDSYSTFADQYGSAAAEEIFNSQGGCCGSFDRNEIYGEGDVVLTTEKHYALILKPLKSEGMFNSVISQVSGATELENMQDVFHQAQFMYEHIFDQKNFKLGDYFSGLPSGGAVSFSGQIRLPDGMTSTMVMDVFMKNQQGSVLDGDVFEGYSGKGNGYRSWLRSYESGSGMYVPALQITLQGGADVRDFFQY